MRVVSGDIAKYAYFVAVDATDFTTRETGLATWTVYRSRNGGASAAMTTPTINETDATNMPGVYELLLDEDMTIDSGDDEQEMVFHITHAGMAPVTRAITLYRPKITAGNTLGVAADGDISGNVDGAAASVTGTVGGIAGTITTLDALDTAQDTQHSTTQGKVDTAQADLDLLTGTDGATLATAQGNYAPAKATDIVSGGAITTSAGAVSTVTDVTTKTGYSLSTAGILAVWHQLTSAIATAGSVGKLLKDYLDAAISSRSSHSANDVTGGTTVATAESNIRGADSDTLKTLSDALDATATASDLSTLSGTVSTVAANVATVLGKFTGITLLAQWLGAMAGKQASNATALTEINATGAGSGTYDGAADSQEAIRDAAYTGTPPTVEEIRAEMDSNSTKLDAAVSTRSAFNPASDEVDVGKIKGTALAETTAGRLAGNMSVFWDNADADTTQTVDDVGGGGGSGLTAQQTRDAMKLAPSAGAPASGSLDDLISSISGSNTYEVDGEAVIQADGTFRASVWLLLNKAKQNATTAPTVNLVRDDGTVTIANAAFIKAEQAGYTWLITKASVSVSTQYTYELTVEFAGDSGPERSIPVRFS